MAVFPPLSGAFVGNDVVDLREPRTRDRHRDGAFLDRVLSEAEGSLLHASTEAAHELWALWAAKEAAYKVASKLRGSPPVFAHRSFDTAWADSSVGSREGVVRYEDLVIPVTATWTTAYVHAVATAPGVAGEPAWSVSELGPTGRDDLLARLTDREADAVHSVASAAVRVSAKGALARALGLDVGRVEIVCDPGVTGRRPPRVLVDGIRGAADVSLSHHGRWIAWAILV